MTALFGEKRIVYEVKVLGIGPDPLASLTPHKLVIEYW